MLMRPGTQKTTVCIGTVIIAWSGPEDADLDEIDLTERSLSHNRRYFLGVFNSKTSNSINVVVEISPSWKIDYTSGFPKDVEYDIGFIPDDDYKRTFKKKVRGEILDKIEELDSQLEYICEQVKKYKVVSPLVNPNRFRN